MLRSSNLRLWELHTCSHKRELPMTDQSDYDAEKFPPASVNENGLSPLEMQRHSGLWGSSL